MVAEANRRRAAVQAREKVVDAAQAQWEAEARKTPVWTPVEVVKAVSKKGATLTRQPDGSILAGGNNPSPDTYVIKAKTKVVGIQAIRLEVLPDPSLPAKGPGRAGNGNFVLNELTLGAIQEGAPGEPRPVSLHNAKADFSQAGYAVAGAIDNNPATGWAVAPEFGKKHTATFELKEPLTFPNGAVLRFSLLQKYEGGQHNLGRFRLSVSTSRPPLSVKGSPEAIAKILAVDPAQRTSAQKAELMRYHRGQDTELSRLARAAAEYGPPVDRRQPGAQDLVWALINSKAFQFNH
jgi:hypothetical protein